MTRRRRDGFKGLSPTGQADVAIDRQTADGSPLEAFVSSTAPSVRDWMSALPHGSSPLHRLSPAIASLALPARARRWIDAILDRHGHPNPAESSGSVLAALWVRDLIDPVDRERLPARCTDSGAALARGSPGTRKSATCSARSASARRCRTRRGASCSPGAKAATGIAAGRAVAIRSSHSRQAGPNRTTH